VCVCVALAFVDRASEKEWGGKGEKGTRAAILERPMTGGRAPLWQIVSEYAGYSNGNTRTARWATAWLNPGSGRTTWSCRPAAIVSARRSFHLAFLIYLSVFHVSSNSVGNKRARARVGIIRRIKRQTRTNVSVVWTAKYRRASPGGRARFTTATVAGTAVRLAKLSIEFHEFSYIRLRGRYCNDGFHSATTAVNAFIR